MISDFSARKLVDYLQPGRRYLIRFAHGLGDTIMFLPLWRRLQTLYPKSRIDLQLYHGQEGLFGSLVDPDERDYAEIFEIAFLCAERSGRTKAERCCVCELGIPPCERLAALPGYASPLVAVHFHGTCAPEATGCPAPIAERIWAEIGQCGKIPFEVHFLHVFANPANVRFPFTTISARDAAPEAVNLPNLIGLVQRSAAFVGVLSGPAMVALSVMPARCLILENRTRLTDYSAVPAAVVNVNACKPGFVAAWLRSL